MKPISCAISAPIHEIFGLSGVGSLIRPDDAGDSRDGGRRAFRRRRHRFPGRPESFTNLHPSRLSLGATRNISSVGRNHRYATPSMFLVNPISCAISAQIHAIFGLVACSYCGFSQIPRANVRFAASVHSLYCFCGAGFPRRKVVQAVPGTRDGLPFGGSMRRLRGWVGGGAARRRSGAQQWCRTCHVPGCDRRIGFQPLGIAA